MRAMGIFVDSPSGFKRQLERKHASKEADSPVPGAVSWGARIAMVAPPSRSRWTIRRRSEEHARQPCHAFAHPLVRFLREREAHRVPAAAVDEKRGAGDVGDAAPHR